MKILNKRIKVIENCSLTSRYYKLILDSSQISKLALPGQFLHIKVDAGFDPLLRRPLSIHRIEGNRIEIIYEIIGRGTKILSEKVKGDFLDVLGPLGNGFSATKRGGSAKNFGGESGKVILVAGGIGVAPLTFLAEKLVERKTKNEKGKIIALIGAKTKNEVLCVKEFKDLGCQVKVATDDGSFGFKGRVTDLLKKHLLNPYGLILTTIYACGPKPMLKEIQAIADINNIDCQVSLDEAMGCGIGACFACVVNTTKGLKRVCKDGPVFDAKELIF